MVDKTVGATTATEAPMTDGPAAGGDGKGDEIDKEVQGKLAEEPEEGDDKGGRDDAGGAAPMEEVASEAEEAEPKSVAKQVLTHFILADNKGKATGQQKGQFVKQIVQSKLDGKHLTSEPGCWPASWAGRSTSRP